MCSCKGKQKFTLSFFMRSCKGKQEFTLSFFEQHCNSNYKKPAEFLYLVTHELSLKELVHLVQVRAARMCSLYAALDAWYATFLGPALPT